MSGVAEEMAPKAAFDAPVSREDRTLIAYCKTLYRAFSGRLYHRRNEKNEYDL